MAAQSTLRFLPWSLGLVFALVIPVPRPSNTSRQSRARLLLASFALATLASCGGSAPTPPSGTPTGSYTLTVSGTSKGAPRTTTVLLTVN